MSSHRPRIVSIEEIEAAEPYDGYNPPGAPAETSRPKFPLEIWRDIVFVGSAEWLVKRTLPRQGLAAIYGRPGSFKSFVAFHIAFCVALGRSWGGRRVTQASAVYIAAEGSAGLSKRKAAYCNAEPDLPPDLPFARIPVAPNLGSEKGDVPALIASIEVRGLKPGLIVVDTLSRTMGTGDENGSGMQAFIASAGALADHFKALVLIVHHTGLGEGAEKRLRGHSSLNGALDAQLLCERVEGDLAATLTLQKLKDDASDVRLLARLSRVVIGHDEDGDEISSLIVDAVEDAEGAKTEKPKAVPRSQRLLMSVIAEAIDEKGETFRPFEASGPIVRGVLDTVARGRFFARIAEQAAPDEDREKLADRQRKSFNRSLEAALRAETLMAMEKDGRRILWIP